MSKSEVQARSDFEFAGLSVEPSSAAASVRSAPLPLLSTGVHVHSWRYKHVKRWTDIGAALLMLSFSLAPGLVIAIAILITSKGPVFYRETRIGRGGKPFRIWKFRSMSETSQWHDVIKSTPDHTSTFHWRVHKAVRDPRITPVGAFIRRWSLDELPQLLNVLRGDMSLVGPRPVIAAEVPLYGHLQHFYLAATPGLSGLWQVSGRSNISFAGRANLDASYVRNWSLRTDFLILLRTIPAVLGKVGAR
ncbi:sugar transferase [Acidicapsa dinghuensis]|uniref:Sugar transferase n=1 Tax=Acidicapsa dinghuensis TaxID=2218256 RepID=A0ABW1EET7_9BACT|nr:sugar transferase [Acidicapsa dinghuensis]